jgi:hypothetical protein
LINAEIAAAKAGSPLYKKALLEDPSENLIRAHVATLEWNMMSQKFGMTAAELVRLQENERRFRIFGTHEYIGCRPYGKDDSWIRWGKPFKAPTHAENQAFLKARDRRIAASKSRQ